MSDPALFRDLVNLSLDLITLVDEQGVIVLANPAMERVFGRRVGDRIGRAVLEFVHPQDQALAAAALARLIDGTADTEGLEVRLRREDGEWRHIEALGRRLMVAGRPHVLLNSRDTTDRTRVLAELARSNERLGKTLRSSRNIVSITRARTGEYLEVNDEWLRAWGHQRHEVIGRTANELGVWGKPANRERVMAAIRAAGGQLRDYEVTAYARGGPRQLVINVETLGDDDDEPLILMTGTDITESRATEEKLRHAQKMEAVGQLTGGVAHDFNNLLGVIMGNAELLALAVAQHPQLMKLVEPILQASNRGGRLTRQLLAFSRRQVLAPRAVALEAVLRRMVPLLDSTMGPGVRVTLEAPEDAWPALVDPAEFENAVLNLAINARDAMPEGGQLSLELRNRSAAEAAGEPDLDLAPGNYVSLTVADTGRGMDAQTLARAFDPFFTTKEPGEGTGLGLSMVFGFVRQSGGQIRIASEPGTGSRLTLWLPRALPVADPESTVPADVPLGSGETVLVLDDEGELLAIARAFLEQLGYRVLTARDESDVQALLDAGLAFDLVLSDVLLAGPRRGPEVVAAIQARRGAVPVVYMSGYPSRHFDDGLLVGARVPLLRKPFSRAELAQRVRAGLDG